MTEVAESIKLRACGRSQADWPSQCGGAPDFAVPTTEASPSSFSLLAVGIFWADETDSLDRSKNEMTIAVMYSVLTQILISLLFSSALAVSPPSAFSQSSPGQNSNLNNYHRLSISGWLENNNGRLRLILNNDSGQQFHGLAKIGLGDNEEQKEIGQIQLALPARELSLMEITGVNPSGNQYSLSVYDQRGVRVFFKIAPLRAVFDSTPAITVALLPVQLQRSKASPLIITGNGSAIVSPAANDTDEFARVATQVQVQARLLANEEANDSFILLFELRAQRPVYNATISMTAGKIKERKPISVNLQSQAEFKLPNRLDSDKISYLVTGKNGKVLAKGELDLQQLMADDYVAVADIRTDRSVYNPGETVRVTILQEGRTRAGYRLEVAARHGQNQNIFQDQKSVSANDQHNSFEFVIAIPNNVILPLVFEFKIYDAETGLLFDSGEREIPMTETKSQQKG